MLLLPQSKPHYHKNNSMFYFDKFATDLRTIASLYYWSPVVFSFFLTPLILRHSIYRSWFVACCRTGAGYVCLQLRPFVLLPFAKRILTWNDGINAGTWNRSAPCLTSSGFKWTLLGRTAKGQEGKICFTHLDDLVVTLRLHSTTEIFLSLFLEVFTISWTFVNRCSISRFTRVP